MEQFAFLQPPKNRQRRCILRRWRRTVPDARTGDTDCTVAYGGPSRPRGVHLAEADSNTGQLWLQRLMPFCV